MTKYFNDLIKTLRFAMDSRKFKKNRFKKGRGEDFHHE